MFQKIVGWVKESISKKLVVTIIMFALAPYLAKAKAHGWDISEDMITKLLDGLMAGGGIYVVVQGVKDWITAHFEGKLALAQYNAPPQSAPPPQPKDDPTGQDKNSDQNTIPGT